MARVYSALVELELGQTSVLLGGSYTLQIIDFFAQLSVR